MKSSDQVVLTGSQFRANDNQATDVAVGPADGELQPHVTKSACQLQRRPQWSARIGIKGDIVDAIGALHSNGIRPAPARADMPQTALPSPTELQDGEGGCEPRAPPRAESGGGGCKCCLEAADGPHWLGARRRPLRGAADAALRLDTGSKVHCGELLAICDRGDASRWERTAVVPAISAATAAGLPLSWGTWRTRAPGARERQQQVGRRELGSTCL